MDDFQKISDAFEKYSDMVYRLAFARVKNTYDADDILQEVFIRLMRSKNTDISDEHTKALLIRITINCSKNFLGNAWERKTSALNETISCEIPQNDTLEAVLKLPLKYRTVIHLHYYCGYSVDEIASVISVKPSAVKSRLFRARKKLKNELKGVEF